MDSTSRTPRDIPDYKRLDYRGFVFVVHQVHGMLLLHCTRKPKKGPHYQLPGGHIDEYEFKYSAEKCGLEASSNSILLEAAKMGTARELFEETGIDVRGQLHRLDDVPLSSGESDLSCMLQNKCYFSLTVTDEDFPIPREDTEDQLKHPNDNIGSHLTLKLSHEHSGFIFENDPMESMKKIQKHSGGTGSRAIQMSMNRSTDRNVVDDVQPHKVMVTEKDNDQSATLLPPPKRTSFFSCFRSFC